MRRSMIGAILLLFSGVAAAEWHDSIATSSQAPQAIAQVAALVPGLQIGGQFFVEAVPNFGGATASSQASPTARKSKTRKKQTKRVAIPTIADTRVGYIEEAVVGSQVRVRFDAAFHDNSSDLAEFFYAQYAGLNNNAPGPNFVFQDLNLQRLYMNAEFAPKRNMRWSFFGEVPVRWIQPAQLPVAAAVGPTEKVNTAGLSDVAAGLKLAAVASTNQYLTFQFKAFFPSGNASESLGTNHYSIEPALLYYRRFSDRVALEAQFGDSHPIGGSSCPISFSTQSAVCHSGISGSKSAGFAGDVLFYGVGPSYVVFRNHRVNVAPVVELVGWRVLGGLVTVNLDSDNQVAVSASGTNMVNLKAGARTSIGSHSSWYIGAGYALTHSHWYKGIVRAEYRFSF